VLTTSWRARGLEAGVPEGGGGFQETGRRPELGAEMGSQQRIGLRVAVRVPGHDRQQQANRPWTGGRRILHLRDKEREGNTSNSRSS
jgi:hypothetical protein